MNTVLPLSDLALCYVLKLHLNGLKLGSTGFFPFEFGQCYCSCKNQICPVDNIIFTCIFFMLIFQYDPASIHGELPVIGCIVTSLDINKDLSQLPQFITDSVFAFLKPHPTFRSKTWFDKKFLIYLFLISVCNVKLGHI